MTVFVRILDLSPLPYSEGGLEKISAQDISSCQKLCFSCDLREFSTPCEKKGENIPFLQGLYSDCDETTPSLAKATPFDARFLVRFLKSGDSSLKLLTNAKVVANEFSEFYKNYVFEVSNPKLSAERFFVSLLIHDFFYERYSSLPPPLCKSERGKPFFPELPLLVSISHTDGLVCCAFAETNEYTEAPSPDERDSFAKGGDYTANGDSGEFSSFPFSLGLDAQAVPSEAEYHSLKRIAERFLAEYFPDAEPFVALSQKELCDAVSLLWTKKESLVKMTGEGLGGARKDLPISYRQKSFSLFRDGGKRKYYVSLSLKVPSQL